MNGSNDNLGRSNTPYTRTQAYRPCLGSPYAPLNPDPASLASLQRPERVLGLLGLVLLLGHPVLLADGLAAAAALLGVALARVVVVVLQGVVLAAAQAVAEVLRGERKKCRVGQENCAS